MHQTSASGFTSTSIFIDSTYNSSFSATVDSFCKNLTLAFMRYCKTTDLLNWWSISADKFQARKPVFPQELWYLVQSYHDIVGWVIAKDSHKKTVLIRKNPTQPIRWNISLAIMKEILQYSEIFHFMIAEQTYGGGEREWVFICQMNSNHSSQSGWTLGGVTREGRSGRTGIWKALFQLLCILPLYKCFKYSFTMQIFVTSNLIEFV